MRFSFFTGFKPSITIGSDRNEKCCLKSSSLRLSNYLSRTLLLTVSFLTCSVMLSLRQLSMRLTQVFKWFVIRFYVPALCTAPQQLLDQRTVDLWVEWLFYTTRNDSRLGDRHFGIQLEFFPLSEPSEFRFILNPFGRHQIVTLIDAVRYDAFICISPYL